MEAKLVGTALAPQLHLKFHPGARIPAGVVLPKYPKPTPPPWAKGKQPKASDKIETYLDWVKWLPGRRWDKKNSQWVVTAPGPIIERVLLDLNFDLELPEGFSGNLDRFYTPVVMLDEQDPWISWVYPRFMGANEIEPLLPAFNLWSTKQSAYMVYTSDLLNTRLPVPPAVIEKAKEQATLPVPGWSMAMAGETSKLALAPDLATPNLKTEVGDFHLYGYQSSGIEALRRGHTLLADEPGLGKTIQAIAAHKDRGTRRLAIFCPPKVMTNWGRELKKAGFSGEVAIVYPTRKTPKFPDQGAVVIADSTLASRPALQQQILQWAPDGAIYDEAHRGKTFNSARSRAVSRIMHQVSGLKIPITGTPIISKPVDLIPLLSQSGHLDPIFGGASAFVNRYCTWNRFRGWTANKTQLERLREDLDRFVWVHRLKDDVLDLPPIRKVFPLVDVDLELFTEAHADANRHIDEWLEKLGQAPTLEEIEEWASGRIDLVSGMRKAAGLSKVDAAIEFIEDHLTTQTGPPFDRPIIVWTHHRAVTEALIEATKELSVPVEAIWGETPERDTPRIIDDFQAGKIGVLIASITAAGVGLTLTRAADALMVETDWTPALVQQAIDRMNRIGQERPMMVTTLLAAGTLDERIQGRQDEISATLNAALGGNHDVAEDEGKVERSTVSELLTSMTQSRVRKMYPTEDRSKA